MAGGTDAVQPPHNPRDVGAGARPVGDAPTGERGTARENAGLLRRVRELEARVELNQGLHLAI